MTLMEHILSIFGFPSQNAQKRDAETSEFAARVANVRRLSERATELLDDNFAEKIKKSLNANDRV